jgi:hypothetical protein
VIARADAIARGALAEVDGAAADNAGALAGLVEKHARLAAAEEAYIAVAPDLARDRRLIRISGPVPLGPIFAVRASVAYKGSWVRRTRTFAKDTAGARALARGDAWLDHALRSLVAGMPLAAQLAGALRHCPGAALNNFMTETCIGSYPLEAVATSRSPVDFAPPAGTFLVLSVELTIDGIPWLGAAPAFVPAPPP